MSSILYYDYTNTLSHGRIFGISHTRGKEFRKYWPQVFYLEEGKDSYKWWRERLLIDGFNETCNNIAASYLKVGDESMSAIFPDYRERGLNPLVLYFLQGGTNWYGVQDRVLFCHWVLGIN